MEFINFLIDNYNIPILSAFLLGLLSTLSPCTLAANVGAVAFISKDLESKKHIVLKGLSYTLGRGLSYCLLGILVYFGISAFSISSIFQGWGSLLLGPIFVFLGLVTLGVIKLNKIGTNSKIEKLKKWLAAKGYVGSLLLGMLLALAFCPYSGVLFFGALMPLALHSSGGFLLFLMFALGTGLPVIIFAFFVAFSMQKVGQMFDLMRKIEKMGRVIMSIIFLMVGIYYSQYLIKYLFN